MHANINIVGRLTRDPKLIETGNSKFITFGVAVNRYDYKERDQVTDFYDVITFGNVDGHIKNIGKGTIVAVAGPCEQKEYETKNGEIRKNIQVNAREINYIDNFGSNRGNKSSGSTNDVDVDIDLDLDDIDLDDDDTSMDDLLAEEQVF